MDTSEMFDDETESASSKSDSGTQQMPHKKLSEPGLKPCHSKQRSKNVKRYSSSFKTTMEKYDTCSKSDSGDLEQSEHKRLVPYSRARTSSTDSVLSAEHHKKSRDTRHDKLPVDCPISDRFGNALSYRTTCLAYKSCLCDDKVVWDTAKWSKTLEVQMKSQTFDSFDPYQFVILLSAFKLMCDTNRIHEGAVIWILQLFMKFITDAALKACIALKSKSHRQEKEGTSNFVIWGWPRIARDICNRRHNRRTRSWYDVIHSAVE